jgi:hypothetical protein
VVALPGGIIRGALAHAGFITSSKRCGRRASGTACLHGTGWATPSNLPPRVDSLHALQIVSRGTPVAHARHRGGSPDATPAPGDRHRAHQPQGESRRVSRHRASTHRAHRGAMARSRGMRSPEWCDAPSKSTKRRFRRVRPAGRDTPLLNRVHDATASAVGEDDGPRRAVPDSSPREANVEMDAVRVREDVGTVGLVEGGFRHLPFRFPRLDEIGCDASSGSDFGTGTRFAISSAICRYRPFDVCTSRNVIFSNDHPAPAISRIYASLPGAEGVIKCERSG